MVSARNGRHACGRKPDSEGYMVQNQAGPKTGHFKLLSIYLYSFSYILFLSISISLYLIYIQGFHTNNHKHTDTLHTQHTQSTHRIGLHHLLSHSYHLSDSLSTIHIITDRGPQATYIKIIQKNIKFLGGALDIRIVDSAEPDGARFGIDGIARGRG